MSSDLHPLLPSGAEKLRELFAPLSHHLAIWSVLDGRSPGYIFTDDQAAPQVGLLWTQQRVFLAGESGDASLRDSVKSCLDNQFRMDADKRGVHGFTLAHTLEWGPFIDEVLATYMPMHGTRHYFERPAEAVPASSSAAYRIEAVDGSLLSRNDLSGQADLLEEMQSERPSVADFLMKSFGYMAVDGADIIGWCLSEYNTYERCELGIATAVAFRRQGVALATAGATIERAEREGIHRIGWHCWTDNAPSVATARALGFTLKETYPVAFAYTDPQQSMAVHAYIALEDGDVSRAIEWLSEAEALGDLPSWALVHKARTQAALGRTATAVDLLARAARSGFVDFDQLEQDQYLAAVRTTSSWAILRKGLA